MHAASLLVYSWDDKKRFKRFMCTEKILRKAKVISHRHLRLGATTGSTAN